MLVWMLKKLGFWSWSWWQFSRQDGSQCLCRVEVASNHGNLEDLQAGSRFDIPKSAVTYLQLGDLTVPVAEPIGFSRLGDSHGYLSRRPYLCRDFAYLGTKSQLSGPATHALFRRCCGSRCGRMTGVLKTGPDWRNNSLDRGMPWARDDLVCIPCPLVAGSRRRFDLL